MAFNRQKAKQAGYSDSEIEAYLAKKTQGPEQEATLPAALMRLLGGGGIADVAGTGFEVGRQARKALGQDVEQNPYFTGEQAQGFKENPVKEVGSSLLSDLLGALAVGAGVGGVATFGTKAGVAQLANQAAQKGREIPFESLKQKATESVGKLGNISQDVELRDTLNNLLAKITPGQNTLGETAFSSPNALQTRRQLLERYGTSIFDWLRGGPNLEQKVAGSVRSALTGLLHEAAPGTRIPDKLYSLYSKGGAFGGDLPSLAIKYGIGIPLVRKLLGPVGSAITKTIE